jgi:hypothetical protein
MKKRERRREEKRAWEGERKKKRPAVAMLGLGERKKKGRFGNNMVWFSGCIYFVNLSLIGLD